MDDITECFFKLNMSKELAKMATLSIMLAIVSIIFLLMIVLTLFIQHLKKRIEIETEKKRQFNANKDPNYNEYSPQRQARVRKEPLEMEMPEIKEQSDIQKTILKAKMRAKIIDKIIKIFKPIGLIIIVACILFFIMAFINVLWKSVLGYPLAPWL